MSSAGANTRGGTGAPAAVLSCGTIRRYPYSHELDAVHHPTVPTAPEPELPARMPTRPSLPPSRPAQPSTRGHPTSHPHLHRRPGWVPYCASTSATALSLPHDQRQSLPAALPCATPHAVRRNTERSEKSEDIGCARFSPQSQRGALRGGELVAEVFTSWPVAVRGRCPRARPRDRNAGGARRLLPQGGWSLRG